MNLFAAYRYERGEFPHQDMEPTHDQISAVAQIIRSGSSPYVDFALFGPHGARLLKKLSLISFSYQPAVGEWKRAELPGPPDLATWWKTWLVYECTLLLLKEVKPERLRLYGEHIRKLVDTYGEEVWFLIYQADVRMRSEEFDRLRRHLELEYVACSLRSALVLSSTPIILGTRSFP